MPLYDQECDHCGHNFEERRPWDDTPADCPECRGPSHTIWKTVPMLDKAKDPYDLLHGPIPDSKPIKSFANDKRKGGKDTIQ